MKLLIDMNLSPHWVETLGTVGFSVMHSSTLGAATATDTAIVACAAAQNYVVLTQDLDFSAILAVTRGTKPSVVQLRTENLSPEVISVHLVAALRQMVVELEAGALLTL